MLTFLKYIGVALVILSALVAALAGVLIAMGLTGTSSKTNLWIGLSSVGCAFLFGAAGGLFVNRSYKWRQVGPPWERKMHQ